MHIPLYFLFISISIYISATKVKAHEESSAHKNQKLFKNLNSSN